MESFSCHPCEFLNVKNEFYCLTRWKPFPREDKTKKASLDLIRLGAIVLSNDRDKPIGEKAENKSAFYHQLRVQCGPTWCSAIISDKNNSLQG